MAEIKLLAALGLVRVTGDHNVRKIIDAALLELERLEKIEELAIRMAEYALGDFPVIDTGMAKEIFRLAARPVSPSPTRNSS